VRLVPLSLSLPREAPQKIAGEFAKFGTVGVINTVLNYAVFNALILTIFAQGQLKANVIATVIATTASYFMNRHWTYRDRPKSALRREYALFFVFNLAGLVIELGVLALSKYGLGLTSLLALNIAKTFGLGLGTIFRFWAYRTFVFPVAALNPAAVPGQPVAVEQEFDQLTAPLEAEWVDVELEAELRSRSSSAPAPASAQNAGTWSYRDVP
jgi:putative flippase GtrA